MLRTGAWLGLVFFCYGIGLKRIRFGFEDGGVRIVILLPNKWLKYNRGRY